MPPHDFDGFSGTYYVKDSSGEYVPVQLEKTTVETEETTYTSDVCLDMEPVVLHLRLSRRSSRRFLRMIHADLNRRKRMIRKWHRHREQYRRARLKQT